MAGPQSPQFPAVHDHHLQRVPPRVDFVEGDLDWLMTLEEIERRWHLVEPTGTAL